MWGFLFPLCVFDLSYLFCRCFLLTASCGSDVNSQMTLPDLKCVRIVLVHLRFPSNGAGGWPVNRLTESGTSRLQMLCPGLQMISAKVVLFDRSALPPCMDEFSDSKVTCSKRRSSPGLPRLPVFSSPALWFLHHLSARVIHTHLCSSREQSIALPISH